MYPDLNVTIVASKDECLHQDLLQAAKGTYARISRFHELYFEGLFDDMTIFRMWDHEVRCFSQLVCVCLGGKGEAASSSFTSLPLLLAVYVHISVCMYNDDEQGLQAPMADVTAGPAAFIPG